MNPLPLSGCQPFLENFHISGGGHDHKFLGDIRSSGVKLLNEGGQNLVRALIVRAFHEEMLLADQAPVSNKKSLDQDIFVGRGVSDHVPVLIRSGVIDLLTLREEFDAFDLVAQLSGALKIQLVRGLGHFCFQILDHRLMMPAQKFHGFFQNLLILLLCHIAGTRSHAPADMIIQAGPLLADFLRQSTITVAERPDLLHQLQGLPHGEHTGIGAEIASFILRNLPGNEDSGKGLLDRRLYIGILLIILQQRIIRGTVLLDQVIFQDQRFHLRIGHDILKILDTADHAQNLRRLILRTLKILADTILQVHGLPHI